MRDPEQPDSELRGYLIALICLAILVAALALAVFARRKEWERKSGLPSLRSHVLVIPGDVAGAVPAVGGAIPLGRVLAVWLELLPATRVGTRRHLPEYIVAEKKMQMPLGFTLDIPNVIRYYPNVTSAIGAENDQT